MIEAGWSEQPEGWKGRETGRRDHPRVESPYCPFWKSNTDHRGPVCIIIIRSRKFYIILIPILRPVLASLYLPPSFPLYVWLHTEA